jgi:hypothetical protein
MATDFAALAKKLKLAAASRPVIIGGDPAYRDGLSRAVGGPIATELTGRHDWIQLFAPDRATLEAHLPAVAAALEDRGIVWLSYPKGSSKLQADLTRDAGWEAVKVADLMWLTLVSVDDTWSAFSLRRYRPGEARQAFR